MAYTLGNKCAKNLCKRTVLLQLIIENVVTCFFGTQCTIDSVEIQTVKRGFSTMTSLKCLQLSATTTDNRKCQYGHPRRKC